MKTKNKITWKATNNKGKLFEGKFKAPQDAKDAEILGIIMTGREFTHIEFSDKSGIAHCYKSGDDWVVDRKSYEDYEEVERYDIDLTIPFLIGSIIAIAAFIVFIPVAAILVIIGIMLCMAALMLYLGVISLGIEYYD